MKLADLQSYLARTGRYFGAPDGKWGKLTEAGIMLMVTDGPDTGLSEFNFVEAGADLRVQPAAIKAFWKTEANGAGFEKGRPKILPEPHRFSKITGGRFDKIAPDISYAKWRTLPYPKTQDARYDVILAWGKLLAGAGLDIDPMFMAASWGAPQIMGENFAACAYSNAVEMAAGFAKDEKTQLRAFGSFVTNAKILPFLRKVNRTEESWNPVATRYNGTAAALNGYAGKMLNNFIAFGGG